MCFRNKNQDPGSLLFARSRSQTTHRDCLRVLVDSHDSYAVFCPLEQIRSRILSLFCRIFSRNFQLILIKMKIKNRLFNLEF